MTSRLIVLVHPHWPQQPVADWVLVDDDGRCLQHGRGEPRHWPPAEHCEAVLDGAQTAWPAAALPPAPRRERSRLLAFALEEHLVRDPDQEHMTVTHQRETGSGGERTTLTAALVVARVRMRQLCAQFAALGRPLHHAYSALQTAAHATSAWVLHLGPGAGAILRPDAGSGFALDLALPGDDTTATLAAQLEPLLDHARRNGAVPPALELRCAGSASHIDADDLARTLGISVVTAASSPWWAASGATDLLHGEFAGRGGDSQRWRRLRAPAWVAASVAALMLAATAGDVLVQHSERRKLETRLARAFAEALPGTPPVAPTAQLARALDDERTRHGRLGATDLLALLATYARAGGTQPVSLDYGDGRLALTLGTTADAGLAARLALQGAAARTEGRTLTLTPTR